MNMKNISKNLVPSLIILFFVTLGLFGFLFQTASAQGGPSGGIVPCGSPGKPPCDLCQLYVLAKNSIDFMLFDLILPIAIIALLIGGIFLLASSGNPQMMETGKKAIANTVIGVVIAFAAWLIIATIVNTLGYEGFTAAWNVAPTCRPSLIGPGGPTPPADKKFCVRPSPSPGVPATCEDKGTEESCTNGCAHGTCQTSCPGTGFTPQCSADSDSVEVAAIRTCVTTKAASVGLSIDNITSFQGNHSCNPPSSVSCHYGGTQPPPCNGTAHAIDFSLVPAQSNATNFQRLRTIAEACPGIRNVFCESGTQRFSDCNNSSIDHIHVNDAASASCGCN